MAAPRYIADPEESVRIVALDGLSVLFHEPSGTTHIVAPPAPEILAALRDGPATIEELFGRLADAFDLEPSPLMGEGWVGVDSPLARSSSSNATPPQPLPIEGRGLDALQARIDELEQAGLVRRA